MPASQRPSPARLLALAALSLSFVFTTWYAFYSSQAGVDMLWFHPESATAGPGESIFVAARLDYPASVYAVDLQISYHPSVVAIVDADPALAGIQVQTGSCPRPEFALLNQADNAAGALDYAFTQLNPTLGCAGGEIALIEFRCIGVGVATVRFEAPTLISDAQGNPIPYTAQETSLHCTGIPSTPGPSPTPTERPPTPTPTPTPILLPQQYLPAIFR